MAFAGMLANDGIKPYIKPSNTKYPSAIMISARAALIILAGVVPVFLYIILISDSNQFT